MSEQLSAPRITAANLDSSVSQHVSIVGKVTQLRGDQADIDADGPVTILLNREAHLTNGNAALIIGKVNPDLSIKAIFCRDVGSGVDHGSRHRLPRSLHSMRVAMIWPRPDDDDVDDFDDFDIDFVSRGVPPSQQHQRSRNCAASASNVPSMEASTPPSAQRAGINLLPLCQLESSEYTATASSPAWSHRGQVSPDIPSAQPYSYPFSFPPSGIHPLTPLSPLKGQDEDDCYGGDSPDISIGTSSTGYSDVPDELLEAVIDGISNVQVD